MKKLAAFVLLFAFILSMALFMGSCNCGGNPDATITVTTTAKTQKDPTVPPSSSEATTAGTPSPDQPDWEPVDK